MSKLFSLFDMYDELNCALDSVHLSRAKTCATKPDQLYIDFNTVYNGNTITYFYVITKYPRKLIMDFKDTLRDSCVDDIRITFYNKMQPHKIDWNSQHMRNKLTILAQIGAERNSEEVTAYNKFSKISDIEHQKLIEDSLLYLSDADITRHRALLKSTMIVQITGTSGEIFDKTVTEIEAKAKHMGLEMTRMLYNLPDFLKATSPFTHSNIPGLSDKLTANVLTDEIVARMNVYAQGILGARGIDFGSDIFSGFPVLKQVKRKSDDAENWLITAETGGGKSFLVKFLLLQLMAISCMGTIMDFEGAEYKAFGEFLSQDYKVQTVNMSEGQGNYFDPVEIAPRCGDPDIDIDSKNMSVNYTIMFFRVLLTEVLDKDQWLTVVIDDAVAKVYQNAGVTENMQTWSKSQNLTLFDVYEAMKTLKGSRNAKDYDDAVEKALAFTGRYFEKDGTRAGLFKQRVRITDVADADLVICSFGMAGKSEASIDKVQLALMQLGASQFSHQRSIFAKVRGKFNFKVWEEVQRWGDFAGSEKIIGPALTGGRKLGDINIVITNNIAEILEHDKFKLMGNVQSFLIGNIKDNDIRKAFCERKSIMKLLPELDNIAQASPDEDEKDIKKADTQVVEGKEDSVYRYAFLCGLDNNKFGVVKVNIPKKIADSKLFYTGVNK